MSNHTPEPWRVGRPFTVVSDTPVPEMGGSDAVEYYGGHLIAVPPKNTSRTCPCCGHISKDNRATQARFACVECGFEENADVVGAINVLRAGHARLACEVSGATMPPAAGTHRSESGVRA